MLEVKLEVGVILGPDPEHLTVGQLASSLYFPFAALWGGGRERKTETQAPPESTRAFTVEGLSSLPSELDSQTQGTFHLSLTKSSRHIAVRPIYDHIRPIEGYAPCSSRAGTHRESPAERHPPVSLPDTLPGSSTGVDTRTIRLDHGIRMEANGNDQRRAVRISELLPLGLSKISLQLSRDKASRRGSGVPALA